VRGPSGAYAVPVGDVNRAWRGVTPLTSLMSVLFAGLLVLASAVPAAAGTASERITDFTVAFALRMDGSMHVTETIRYDFGNASGRHGIERFIPVKFSYDSERNRVYPLTHPSASSPTGAPSGLEITEAGVTTLWIGDEGTTVSGVQTYVLQYDLAGVVNTVGGGQELYWNALGVDTAVPVEKASVTVTGPGAAVQRAACFQGREGSDEPCAWSVSGGTATYTATRKLAPHEGLAVVAGFPTGTFPGVAPILREKWRFTKAFAVNAGTGAGATGVVALLAGGTGLVIARRGRDRRYLGLTPGLAPGIGQDERTGPVGWRRPPVAVRFTPPDQLRVGELGTLIDEHADVEDVTATIIDLAVRGYLRIEEVSPSAQDEGDGTGSARPKSPGDWVLIKTDKRTDELRDYEDELYDAIFSGRRQVRLSQLRTTFSADLRRIQTMLYAEVTDRGWFAANPSTVRARWLSLAGTVLTVGVVGTVLLAIWTHLALVGVAVVVSGVVMLVLAGRMPARTAAGTALLAQVQGFRLYLETAEADQIRFEEGQDVFSRYLPYAIVFGVAERWADLFARIAASGEPLPEPVWYGGHGYAWGAGGFDYHRFGTSMDDFSDRTSSSIAASPPVSASASGSSGFSGGVSGGGGGGGGVGSW
jgi:hypothetical protein